MLFPKKVKYRKWSSARSNPEKKTVATRGTTVAFGSHGLKALTPYRITSNQIEAARRVISRSMGKTGRIWIRIFPDRPFTRKGAETPMGSGKGEPQGFVVEVKPGRVMFEIDGVSDAAAREAFRRATAKLPVKTLVVTRT
ncbi:50S ribosomal protein L16 [Candidatus Kaiserbacteria bacterium CG10_big_fil_rev_8_21_14_0_10_45_20]|uniref:Large ribosomal subunit protein uL16 n=1 Tax=Candidatus Kaiserbacteria bacterium CG10_big_fil_rev_8_21_14_0_10_45_20 TaxID=1974607 RepID=A0A2H0UH84_9BACT|nr:MAG: 50S ribosomal protein L16 [Candidatus Kaiserbacteria bacterium CG10_big_fil_rev_8_21_14_0_10_45_20]